MPENTSVAAARMLSLVTWISRQPGQTTTVGELSAHFGRKISQIERDLQQLTFFRDSLPGESFELQWQPVAKGARTRERSENPVTIRQTHSMALPTVMTDQLAARALVGLRAIAPTLPQDLLQEIPSTMLTVEALTPDFETSAHTVESSQQLGENLLPIISEALHTGACLLYDYTNISGCTQPRHVLPRDLIHRGAGWVVEAIDCDLGETRTFSVKRMNNVTAVMHDHDFSGVLAESAAFLRLLIQPEAERIVGDFAEYEDPSSPLWPRWVRIRMWNRRWVRSLLISAMPWIEDCDDPELLADACQFAGRAHELWAAIESPVDLLQTVDPADEGAAR